jgi:hypothetical protein
MSKKDPYFELSRNIHALNYQKMSIFWTIKKCALD